jgi:threonine dehydrogenase-like Zn-dependent dehydrogenase
VARRLAQAGGRRDFLNAEACPLTRTGLRDSQGHRRPCRTNSETTAQGKLTPEKFVSHRFRLDSLMEAYDTFGRATQTKALKVAIAR